MSNIQYVRWLIGDTDTDDELLQDAQINFFLTQNSDNIYYAGAAAAEAIAAKFARETDKAAGVLRVNAGQKHTHYLSLASQLRKQAMMGSVAPFAGGISKMDKENYRDDTDRVRPKFTRDLHRHPGTPGDDDDDDD